MAKNPSKQSILSEIEYAEARLKTMIALKDTDGANAISARIAELMARVKELEDVEVQESPKLSVAIQTPSITTKTEATKIVSQKKEKTSQPTARKIVEQEEFTTSLKLSEMFLKTSDFTFFQQTVRLICARFRQFDKLKDKKERSKAYYTALIALQKKCLKIIEYSVKSKDDRETIKNTVYSSWIKGKSFTLNSFEDFLKEIGIKL